MYRLVDLIDILKVDKANVIHRSDSKKTAVIEGEINHCGVIIKMFEDGAGSEVVSSFKKEVGYYLHFSNEELSPKLRLIGENYLVVERKDGGSLFEYFKDNQDSSKSVIIAEKIVKLIKDFNQSPPSYKTDSLKEWEICKLLLGKLKNLFYSGPKGTNISKSDYLKLKLLYRVSLPLIIPFVYLAVRNLRLTENNRRYHGDLHMNNFILDDKGQVFLIDFECVQEKPLLLVDLAYCCATQSALCENYSLVVDKYCDIVSEKAQKQIMNRILSLFAASSKLNPRFCMPNEHIHSKKVFTFIAAVISLFRIVK